MPAGVPPGYDKVITKNNAARRAAASKPKPVVTPSKPKGHTNPVVDESGGGVGGGRVDPRVKKAAKAAAASKPSKTTNPAVDTNPAAVDPAPITGNPEDIALQQNPGYGPVGSGGVGLAGQFDPAQYAAGMAGKQYDPQILTMAKRIKGIIGALPGSIDSLHRAFANLDARAAAPPVEKVIGNSGGAAAAYQGTLAAIDNSSAASQAASAASRGADWEQRIRLISSANVNDLRGQLGGLQAGKADAYAGYYGQGIKTKSDLVSQAIANVNSIRASNDAEAMVKGQLVGQGLKNDAQSLANSGAALQQQYYGPQAEQGLIQGNQTIQNNDVSIAAAKNTLKTMAGNPTTLKDALATGHAQADSALRSLIIPTTGIVQDATGAIHVTGDPNQWMKAGVAQIMRQLPGTIRANAVKYVKDVVATAIGPAQSKQTGQRWEFKNGKWHRPK